MILTERAMIAAREYNHYMNPAHKGYGRPQMESAMAIFRKETGLLGMFPYIAMAVIGDRNPACLYSIDYAFTDDEIEFIQELKENLKKNEICCRCNVCCPFVLWLYLCCQSHE